MPEEQAQFWSTTASDRVDGRCVDCGQFMKSYGNHFHFAKTERVKKVWSLGEWGEQYLARGTHDLDIAKAAVVSHIVRSDEYDDKEEVPAAVDRMRAEIGWYRCNPCTCGESHSFDLGIAEGSGPGNFKGVLFTS